MAKKELTQAQIELIKKWLPFKALSAREGARGDAKTSIAPWSVTDRLNDVFGIDGWTTDAEFVMERNGMVVVKLLFNAPDYGIHHTTFGGNNNKDLGDAFKGAETDALTKVASWLGIGTGVWRGEYAHDHYVVDGVDLAAKKPKSATPQPKAQPKKKVQVKRVTNVEDIKATIKTLMENNADVNKYYTNNVIKKSFADFTDQDILTVWQHLDEHGYIVD